MRAAVLRFLVLGLTLFAVPAPAGDLRPFDAKSLEAIRQAHAGKPFVLAFWSIDCAPCREEMGEWGPLQRKYPAVPILLVATDPPQARATVTDFLARHELGPVQTWAYNDDFAERVRFAVDRSWRGELPRTYLFDAAHRRQARSGRLDRVWMEKWLAQQEAQQRR